jgi:hypothetical protein
MSLAEFSISSVSFDQCKNFKFYACMGVNLSGADNFGIIASIL